MIEYAGKFQSVSFEKIQPEQFKPAFEWLISKSKAALQKIIDNPSEPDFSNTVEALEYLNYELKRLEQVFFNINAAETSMLIQRIAQEISPILTSFYNDISLNESLFSRIRKVYNLKGQLGLNTEQLKLLDDTYKMFVRNGAHLDSSEKNEYRKITEELSGLTLKFDENLLAETNAYKLQITDENDLSGLPEFVVEAAAMEAKAANLAGWVFTLKAPSFLPFMKYSDHRHLREEMYRAYNTRCFKPNDRDNREIIRSIVNLRLRLANLLGYSNYAAYVLEERMAGSVYKVDQFLKDLLYAARPAAEKEYRDVQEYAHRQGVNEAIQRWDWAYYSEKLKNERFSVTDEMTKPYFRLEKVEAGIFDLADRLYGLTFQPDVSIPVYHPEVKTYQVKDEDGKFLALLYIDYFPREGKQGGAWMTNYLEQYRENGKDIRPHVSLVLNFTKPTASKPSLITYEEVRTFLHEFGHALHSMLSRCSYQSLAGTNVYRDFVELPSQIMENWTEEKEWLHMIAVHYETGEQMPDQMVDNILKSRNFNSGYAFVRQLGFGLDDMAWHTLIKPMDGSVAEFEQVAMAPAEVFPPVPGTCFSTGFHHIFGGGYAAGYYGYKWAEVLDADAFAVFKQNGIFDKATARAFREHILSRGGTEDPSLLYKRFRGQEPSVEPLLMRSGLK